MDLSSTLVYKVIGQPWLCPSDGVLGVTALHVRSRQLLNHEWFN